MKAVELFAGIGGFRQAADKMGWRTLWANDVSSKACSVYKNRFGVFGMREGNFAELIGEVPSHDVLTGGFPCQPFSSAGKKEGIRDVRGTLFQLIVDVLKKERPKFFILENVKRLLTMEKGEHFATILGALAELDYSVEWRLLNAMDLGLAQNRQRVFIVGSRHSDSGARQTPIRLAPAHDLGSLNANQHDRLFDNRAWRPIQDHRKRFPDWGIATAGTFFGADLPTFSGKAESITMSTVLQPSVPKAFDFTESTLKWIGENSPVNRFVHGVEILSNQRGGARMGYTIFGVNGVAPTLTSTASRHYERYKVGDRYRRLTNVEYARLQGFPDDHCVAVSVYDQYALYGNAVPPPMAEWVMKRLVTETTDLNSIPRRRRQVTLFDIENAV